MTAAIVHYHLRRGGVTRVIEGQSQALRRAGIDHVVLSGTPYRGRVDLPVAIVPELDYRSTSDSLSGDDLAARLRTAARNVLGAPPDLWHLHNPVLGKNVLFPPLLAELVRNRERLVLHAHDFAEDGRPGNYRALRDRNHLYPVAPQIRHAFINSRDRELLIAAGLPRQHAVDLPNPVVLPAEPPGPPDPARPPTVLYPVRGIRRKNLGEFCLLAALAPPGPTFALTLAPENTRWRPFYELWTEAAARHRLPVHFDVAGRLPPAPDLEPTYENWLAHASHIVTTSVAEGFGLTFLEPIAHRRPLFGRDLPDITADFKTHHIGLGALYRHLLVPADWIGRATLHESLVRSLRSHYSAYGIQLSDELIDQTHQSLLHGNHLDFANLPEELQLVALQNAIEAPDEVMVDDHGKTQPATAWLAGALAVSTPSSDPAALAPYSLPNYADRLASLYHDLLDATPAPPDWLDNSRVLHQFLRPHRFHFLRSS